MDGVTEDDDVFAGETGFFCGGGGEDDRVDFFVFGDRGAEKLRRGYFFAFPIFEEMRFF